MWLGLAVAVLLAVSLVWWLGRGAARGLFVLTPGGRSAAVAAQRFDVLLYFRRFDMGQFRLQPLIVQTGSISHDYADYNVGSTRASTGTTTARWARSS
jgi:hypothetical protein